MVWYDKDDDSFPPNPPSRGTGWHYHPTEGWKLHPEVEDNTDSYFLKGDYR